MFSERKIISVKDLKVGDLVVGAHVSEGGTYISTIVGEITSITTTKWDIYSVKGDTLTRPFGGPIIFSGILRENEIEVIDQSVCLKIIELFHLANEQIIEGKGRHTETIEIINEMRHKSRQELQEKYSVVDVMYEIDRPKFLLLEINQTASARSINNLIEAIRWDYKDVVISTKRWGE